MLAKLFESAPVEKAVELLLFINFFAMTHSEPSLCFPPLVYQSILLIEIILQIVQN